MAAFSVLYARMARMAGSEEIKVWVTENPKQYEAPAAPRALAAELLKRFDEARNIRLSEDSGRHRASAANGDYAGEPSAH